MRRSDINSLFRSARSCFAAYQWALPPHPRWDVTDFGPGDWRKFGLVLVNLAEEPEYCEKFIYAQKGMTTPAHCRGKKKEDIICRWGRLAIQVWAGVPAESGDRASTMPVDHEAVTVRSGQIVEPSARSRVTLVPGVYHAFYPLSDECIISEVSTANDDAADNFFIDPEVGRFPGIEEDEPPVIRLLSES